MLRPWRAAALASWLLLAACGSRDAPPDVLLITLDTARADRFLDGGDTRVATPAFDAVAAEGAQFLNAVAPAPLTLPSHASLLTGLDPPDHGVRNNGTHRLRDDVVTLAELLASRGYRTGAFVGSAVLASRYGLAQGFDTYDDDLSAGRRFEAFGYNERPAEQVVRSAVAWLRQAGAQPVFVWVHLFDPHSPYDPPEPERSRHESSPYDGEIAAADRAVGQLLAAYERLRPGAITIITADHGESLGEHGEQTHGLFVYDATLRIPLVIRAPGLGPSRHDAPVGLVDVLPTLLELLELEPPAAPLAGVSLVPLMHGDAVIPPDRILYAESLFGRLSHGWAELRSLRQGRWKLIVGGTPELYDLERDPGEQVDLAPRMPERVRALSKRLPDRADDDPDAHVVLEVADARQLAALGYLVGPIAGDDDGVPRPDPREMLPVLQGLDRAAELHMAGRGAEALALAEELAEQDPGNPFLMRELALLRWEAGQLEAALAAWERTERLAPGDPAVWRARGQVLRQLGRHAEAADAYARAAALDPENGSLRRERWTLLMALGQHDTVSNETAQWLAAHPDDGRARVLGILARSAGDPDRALAELRAAAATRPGDADLGTALADALMRRGDVEAAAGRYRRVLAADPRAAPAATALAGILLRQGRPEQALPVLEAARDPGIQAPRFWIRLAEARDRSGDPVGSSQALRAALRWAPRDPELWDQLGRLERKNREPERAAAAFARAQTLRGKLAAPAGSRDR